MESYQPALISLGLLPVFLNGFSSFRNFRAAGHLMVELGRTAGIRDEITVAGRCRVRLVGMKGRQITDLLLARLPQENPPSS